MSTSQQLPGFNPATAASSNGHDEGLLVGPSEPLLAKAVGRHKQLVASVTVLFAVIGLGVGLGQTTTYTAASALQVGKENPNSPGFYGYVQSASALAAVYSRALTANPVLLAIHEKLGLTPTAAVQRLSAEPIPNSPIFRIIATGANQASAIALANVAAEALVSYESHNNYSADAATLYASYRAASLGLARAKGRLAHLERSKVAPESPTLVAAQAAVYAAQAQSNALNLAYQQAVAAQPSGSLVTPLSSAIAASDDRKSKAELIALIGLIGGLVIGGALAMLLEQRRTPLLAS